MSLESGLLDWRSWAIIIGVLTLFGIVGRFDLEDAELLQAPCLAAANRLFFSAEETNMPPNFMPVAVNFKPAGDFWIASCPSLDIVTQGEDFERAEENLREALRLFFESCLKRGTLEQVLKDAGYSPVPCASGGRGA
ncbi:MAG: type II toxin-antitoxin system HicB family antitoxin [Desulfovibrio sp.]|jgi:predicted RNase H-like HicB family nuclease|nr:type II toxin-antitoxin system HicB family antitoxin [Desulfovibrio sp.]